MLTVTKLNDLANACVEVLHVPYRYAFTFTTALVASRSSPRR